MYLYRLTLNPTRERKFALISYVVIFGLVGMMRGFVAIDAYRRLRRSVSHESPIG